MGGCFLSIFQLRLRFFFITFVTTLQFQREIGNSEPLKSFLFNKLSMALANATFSEILDDLSRFIFYNTVLF